MATPHPVLEQSASTARGVQQALPAGLQNAVRRASELARSRRAEPRERPLLTSVPGLDRLLGHGLPRGVMVELVGRGSCGRFATLLASLKMVTDTGEVAALVDQGEQLDPRSAAGVGIDLERLLWLRPRALPDALAAAEMLVHTGFPLVAVDLGLPPVRGRAPLAAWLRLARSSATHRAVILVGSPYHLSGCAATAIVTADRARGQWFGTVGAPRLLHGVEARLEVARWRGRRPHETAQTLFTLPEAAFGRAPFPESKTVEGRHAEAL